MPLTISLDMKYIITSNTNHRRFFISEKVMPFALTLRGPFYDFIYFTARYLHCRMVIYRYPNTVEAV